MRMFTVRTAFFALVWPREPAIFPARALPAKYSGVRREWVQPAHRSADSQADEAQRVNRRQHDIPTGDHEAASVSLHISYNGNGHHSCSNELRSSAWQR